MITEEKGYAPVEHDEPLPCPFCGSQPKLQQLAHRMSSVKRGRKYVQERVCILASTLTLTADTFWFTCPSCKCSTGPHCTTAAEAARHWNTRLQPTGGAK